VHSSCWIEKVLARKLAPTHPLLVTKIATTTKNNSTAARTPLNSPPSPAATYRPELTPFAQSLHYYPIDHPTPSAPLSSLQQPKEEDVEGFDVVIVVIFVIIVVIIVVVKHHACCLRASSRLMGGGGGDGGVAVAAVILLHR
jgi:hypothetical protein